MAAVSAGFVAGLFSFGAPIIVPLLAAGTWFAGAPIVGGLSVRTMRAQSAGTSTQHVGFNIDRMNSAKDNLDSFW